MGPAAFLAFPQMFLNVVSTGLQRSAEAEAFKANSAELERQAKLTDANAVDALSRGSMLAGAARRKASSVAAQQAIAYTAGGVDASSGTALAMQSGTYALGEAEATTLTNNAAREAWGMQEVGRKYRFQKDQLQKQEDAANIALPFKMVGSLLGGTSTILGSLK